MMIRFLLGLLALAFSSAAVAAVGEKPLFASSDPIRLTITGPLTAITRERSQQPAAGVIPVPYDFDYSGLVNAPYAAPPPILKLSNVRQRQYRGYCAHNNQLLTAAAQFRGARPAILAALASTPGLEQRTIRSATAYLDGFFATIATNDDVLKLTKGCVQ